MSQQPFTRRGAVDLSALKEAAPAAATGGGTGSAYAVTITEQNLQEVLESSMTAPVLLVFYSPARMPESGRLATDLATLSAEFEGRFLVGLVDVDQSPALAQAMQIPTIPLVLAVLDGRPMPLLQDVVPLEELRAALTQVVGQFTAQGITGRHKPRQQAAADETGEMVDPRYAPAEEALERGDIEAAVAEYEKLVAANPADSEAAAGLAMARVLQRTQGVDLAAARAAAAERPDDVAAQTLVADLDLLGGHIDDAFTRLINTVRRTAGSDRDQAREHLLGLFGAVGTDDPRVLRARQNLASALF